MKDTTLCLIGAGKHAKLNIYPALQASGAQISAIATTNLKSAEAAGLIFANKPKAYDNYKEMLQNEVCAGVVVVAQPRDQYEIALNCIKMKKSVFVEKPLGYTSAQATTIADLASQNDVLLMVGFMKRYAPIYQKISSYLKSNTLGLPISFNLFFAADTALFCPTGEDFLKTAAIHCIDLCRFLFGEVDKITSTGLDDGKNIATCVSLVMQNGMVGTLNLVSAKAWSREKEHLTITMENGFIVAEDLANLTVHKNSEPILPSYSALHEEDSIFTPSNTPMSGPWRDLYIRGFVGEMEEYIACLTKSKICESDGKSNIKTMQLIDDICDTLD